MSLVLKGLHRIWLETQSIAEDIGRCCPGSGKETSRARPQTLLDLLSETKSGLHRFKLITQRTLRSNHN
jgi:hypothetical protein